MSLQIQKNNLKILDFIFKHVSFKYVLETDFHKFSVILSVTLNRISEPRALNLYKALMHYDTFRNNVPLFYIDYTNLNSRYLNVLDLVEEQSSCEADLLFVSLMKFYRLFFKESDLSSISLIKPQDFSNFPAVLQGRFYACSIMKSPYLTQVIKSQILDISNKIKVNFFLQEIAPSLIIKEEYEFLMELMDTYYEEIFETELWSSKTYMSLFLISLANVNWKKNNIKTSKRNLELVELKKVELSYEYYVALFYNLTLLKITFTEKKKLDNKTIYKTIKQDVKKTGFTKFITEADKYILK